MTMFRYLMVFGLAACGGAPAFECACSGEDVSYQAEADENGVASEATCTAGFEFRYGGDNGQTAADAEADAEQNCCPVEAADCMCSCDAL